MTTPVALIASIDPILRHATAFALATNQPGTAVITQDILLAQNAIKRTLTTHHGIVSETLTPLEHACLGCAIREDLIPTLNDLVTGHQFKRIAVALPLGADLFIATQAITHDLHPDAHVAAAATIIDPHTFEPDLLGDDLVNERDPDAADDQRSVGETLTGMIEYSDIIVTAAAEPQAPATVAAVQPENSYEIGLHLLEHIRAHDSHVINDLHDAHLSAHIFTHIHDPKTARMRMHPLHSCSVECAAEHGIWRLTLTSDRPFHPQRLLQNIELLASGRLRARGCFWVPTRPGTACVWDGAGGQLALGTLGHWGHGFGLGDARPATHITIIGRGPGRDHIERAFHDTLLTEAETRTPAHEWVSLDDGLSAWLGPIV